MNAELTFWNRWLPAHRRSFYGLLGLLLGAVSVYVAQYVIGMDAVVDWQVLNELQDMALPLDNFTKGVFSFETDAPGFLVTEWFEASEMRVNETAAYVYGVLLAAALAWLLAVVTALPRWWYLGSMMVFIGLAASFGWDILQMWDMRHSAVLVGMLALVLPTSYYFHAFRPDISLVHRLLVFAGLVAAVGLCVVFFAGAAHPVMSLLAYGTRVLALLAVVFVLFVAQEVPAFVLSVITRNSATGRNSLFHFSVITLFYVANLVVAYLRNSGLVDWDLLYINAFYLLLVSVVLGLWGFRRRIDALLSDPYGAMLYGAWAVLALGTIGYAFATGNDPMTDLFEDVVIYSHLGMGVAFYIYVFLNFRGPLTQGLPVYKVMYQPRILPFGLAFALMCLIMFVLLLRVSMLPFNQGVAGYQNYLGDLYLAEQNDVLAESYYKKGLLFQQRNHKSNYALATIARRHNNTEALAGFLKQAITNKPMPHTYAALSRVYGQEDLLFEALFTLREGSRRFPESGELLNNLAMLYERTRVLDSAYYFYDAALRHTRHPEVVRTNLLAFWAKHFPARLDSVLTAAAPTGYVAYESNRMAISTLLRKTDAAPFRPCADSLLNRERFAYLYQYLLNHKARPDTAAAYAARILAARPDNALFAASLDMARAVQHYHTGRVADAVELLKNTAQGSSGPTAAHLSKMLGLWYLQQDAPVLAAYRFQAAIAAGDSLQQLNRAFALSETQDVPRAAALWDSLRLSGVPVWRSPATRMTRVTKHLLGTNTDSLSDADKVAVVYYGRREDASPVVASIHDLSYRASALLYLAQNHLRTGNASAAESDLRALQALELTDSTARLMVKELEMNILWQKKEWPALARLLKTPSPDTAFYRAEVAAHTGIPAEAEKHYRQALQARPFDERIVLAAQQFYNRQNDPERAYQWLVQALQANPAGTEIRKAYVLQSLDLNLTDYAAQEMAGLRGRLSAADYQAFMPQYEAKRALVEKKLAEWR